MPALQLVCATDVALTKFDGYWSINGAERVADASAWVLVIVIVSSAVPPALMVLTEKLLETVGLDDDTASVSEAEQIPAAEHEEDAFVLLTLEGGVIDTALLT